jgi:hypothetical protein
MEGRQGRCNNLCFCNVAETCPGRFRRHRGRRRIDGDVAALAAVIWTMAALIETSTIDGIVIEIDFGATAKSSVERKVVTIRPLHRFFALCVSPFFSGPGAKVARSHNVGVSHNGTASNISRIYRSSAALFSSLLE